MKKSKLALSIAAIGCGLILTACGGGGGSSSSTPPPDVVTPASVTIEGKASKGIIKNGIVSAYGVDASGNAEYDDALVTDRTSSTDGTYSLTISGYEGPVVIEITADSESVMICDVIGIDSCGTGISFGQDIPLDEGFSLKAIVPDVEDGESVTTNVTLLTSMAAELTEVGSITEESAAQSNVQVATLFNITGDLTELAIVDITDASALVDVSDDVLQSALISSAILAEGFSSGVDLNTTLDNMTQSFADNDGGLVANESTDSADTISLEEIFSQVLAITESEEFAEVDFGAVVTEAEILLVLAQNE